MKKTKCIVLLTACFFALFTASLFSAEKGKAPSRNDLLEDIKERLDGEEEIFSYIPGLKRQKDKTGHDIYSYNGVRLDILDQETLEKLSIKISQIATKINTDRIQRQLETIRQTQNIPRNAPAVPKIPPQPPPQARSPSQVKTPPAPPRR